MAIQIRRLAAAVGPLAPISNLISNDSHLQLLPKFLAAVFTTRILSNRCIPHHFSTCSSEQTPSGFVSINPQDGAGTDHQEFQKWHNGGGSFHKSACIDPTAQIEFGAVVHSKSVLSANVHVGSGAIIGTDVTIGQSTRIGYNVALSNCTIGDSCIIHSGACIGQDGFGFFVDECGDTVKKPQNLKARVGNHVEVGANTCIDRGSWRDTIVGDCSKIDNLVQIGHNVVIGKSCMLCGQVGIAGSVTMGDYVTLGGRVAVRDHVSIASKIRNMNTTSLVSNVKAIYQFAPTCIGRDLVNLVRLAANSCVTKDINEPGDYGGFPAVPIREWRRQVATHRRTWNAIAGDRDREAYECVRRVFGAHA